MVTLHDGPADGTSLLLTRSPLFMRVVINDAGEVDVLNLLDDKPEPDEEVYVYHHCGLETDIHLKFDGRKGSPKSGWYRSCEYYFLRDQPGDEVTRSTEAWQAWVVEQVAKELPEVTVAKNGRMSEKCRT